MEIDIITREDLRQFKREMLEEFKQIIGSKAKDSFEREWLKSAEVRKLLGVSPGTLQNLRINGTLPYRKVGGSMYYHREDIRKMMEGGNEMGERMEIPKHAFSEFFERIGDDGRLLPTHIGLVAALFYHHDCGNPQRQFHASRSKLMRFSRIRSIATYHKCLSELVAYGYVEYRPSWHPAKGSRFRFNIHGEGGVNGQD